MNMNQNVVGEETNGLPKWLIPVVIAACLLVGIVTFILVSGSKDMDKGNEVKTMICENEEFYSEQFGIYFSNSIEMSFDDEDNLLVIVEEHIMRYEEKEEYNEWANNDPKKEIRPGVVEERISTDKDLTVRDITTSTIKDLEEPIENLPLTYKELKIHFTGQSFDCK